jgi:hypothetical protein
MVPKTSRLGFFLIQVKGPNLTLPKSGRRRHMNCMNGTIGGDSNTRPFRLRRAGAALLDRFCRCWQRHTEIGQLSVIAEADYRDYASRLVVSHCPTLSVRQRVKRPLGPLTSDSFRNRGAFVN